MTVKANRFSFTIVFILLHSIAPGQVVFPTVEDHVRKVDSFTNVLKTAKEDTNKVKTLLAFGEELLYWSDEERPKSYTHITQALSISEKLHSPYHQIEALLLLSNYYSGGNDHEKALKHAKEALSIAESINDYLKILKCCNWLGSIYQVQKKNDDALKWFNSSLDIAFRLGTREALQSSYYSLAMFYMDKDQPGYPQSIRYFLMVLQIAEETGDIETIYSALNNIGLMYSVMEDYPRSLFYYNQIEKKTKTSPFLSNLLIAYRGTKDYRGGINAINKFIDKNEKAEDLRRLAIGLNYLGSFEVYTAEEMFQNKRSYDSINYLLDKALISFKRSEKIEKESNLKNVSDRYFDLGKTYKLKAKLLQTKPNQDDTVKKYIELALGSFRKFYSDQQNSGYIDAFASLYIGELLVMQARYEVAGTRSKTYAEAFKYLETAIEAGNNDKTTKTIGPALEPVMAAYRVKAELFKELGQYDKSFDALKHYDEVKDSIRAQETRQKIEQMRIASEIIVGTTEEKARYENTIKDMRTNFLKKEDSLAFQRALADERFNQKQKEYQLQQAELTLANNQKQLNLFKFLKTQAELESELIKREEKEKALRIANQERSLQQNQLKLQKTEINLKESRIIAQDRQRQIYISSIGILSLIFGFIFLNIRNRQKTDRLVAAEILKSEKAIASHQMAELELQSLRAQLNPHFMFNSLNAIQELILKEDTDNSHLYLSRFSELLRMLLDNANHAFIPLKKEISLLDHYLSLENLRIPDLKYSIYTDHSIDSNTVLIPNMILQPYIENAIWHGLSHKTGERKLSIELHRKGDYMVCEIEDNGVGRKKAAELKSLYRREHRSKGMELLSKRFNLLSKEYGAGINTTIEDLYQNDTPCGTKVTISIPFSFTESKPIDS